MQPSRAQVEACFFGPSQSIGAKIHLIRRDRRRAGFAARLTDPRSSAAPGAVLP